MLRRIAVLIAGLVMAATAQGVRAEEWQWPSQLTLARMSVTRIQGNVRSDGSGTATGSLQVPGMGSVPVSLNRSSGGDISGSGSVNGRASGVELQGNFNINANGLSGDGRVRLGGLSVPVRLSSDGGSIGFDGSTQVDTQTDTPLATYRFSGSLIVDGNTNRLSITARGGVRRTGKLANQVTTYDVSGIPVGSDGGGSANVGGVSVRFKFF